MKLFIGVTAVGLVALYWSLNLAFALGRITERAACHVQ